MTIIINDHNLPVGVFIIHEWRGKMRVLSILVLLVLSNIILAQNILFPWEKQFNFQEYDFAADMFAGYGGGAVIVGGDVSPLEPVALAGSTDGLRVYSNSESSFSFTFDANSSEGFQLPSGVYVVTVNTGNSIEAASFTLLQ